MIRTVCQSPLGPLTLVSDGAGLCGLYFENHRYPAPKAEAGEDAAIRAATAALADYFAGRPVAAGVAFSLHGTPFQQAVWRALQEIPYGATTTYAAIARGLGAPRAMRAVGAAVGRNPVSILIPCHRVIGADGALTGFAGGLERKRALLALEGLQPAA
jgi:methylated-DNA-[protein]-cysteine S-methyltransferase